MKLVIDRNKWLRGDDKPALLRETDQKMCCLGFFALQCGYNSRDILGEGEPAGMCSRVKKNLWPKWAVSQEEVDDYDEYEYPTGETQMRYHDSDIVSKLIEANDDQELDEHERELRISRLFESQGVEVEFV